MSSSPAKQVQDQFTVTSQDGTASGTVTVTITGTNDVATVSSERKAVTEGNAAAALDTSGQLTITDPDTGEAHVVAQTNAAGTYGTFSIDANGAWSYTGNGAHDELNAGQVVQDQFTVTSQDGTASGTVTVTITGTNDVATVSSETKAVTEGNAAAALDTSGQLTITDPDTGEAHVVAQTNAAGTTARSRSMRTAPGAIRATARTMSSPLASRCRTSSRSPARMARAPAR